MQKYISIIITTFVLASFYTSTSFGMGIPRPTPRPTPSPTPKPTPKPTATPVPCASAGPLVQHEDDEYVVSFQATNGKYVVALCGGDDVGDVLADRSSAGEWETFYVKEIGGGKVSIRSSHGRYLSAENGGGSALHANRNSRGAWEEFKLTGNLTDGAVVGFQTYNGSNFVSARIDEPRPWVRASGADFGPWEQFTAHVSYTPIKRRAGIVHAEGRGIHDDNGRFFPLGQTLMWALHGWKFERDRLKENLQFLRRHRYDYVRILGEVGWAQKEIDPNWDDYQQNLAEFIDYAYDQCGLRTEITIIGGGHESQATSLTQKIIDVVRDRQHKVLNFEVANEWPLRSLSVNELLNLGRMIRQNFPNHLVAISSDGFDTIDEYEKQFLQGCCANLATTHMDRTWGDDGWREVRQPWDWKDRNYPVSHNEPIGPRSSVQQDDDPIRLAMLRAVGIINGAGAFVLHNASGVMGIVDPSRDRPANLWEVPNIDAIMDAVRNVEKWIPENAGDGNHWNNGWPGAPLGADAFWGEGADNHGVNRNYMVATNDGWISTEAGVKDYVMLTASRPSRVEVFDVLQGKVQDLELDAGQSFRLEPLSRDSGGYGAYIIVGHYR